MRLLIDIDGTVLTQQKPGEYLKAEPTTLIIPQLSSGPLPAIEFVNQLFDDGHQVTFYTSRNFRYMRLTYDQLRGYGFRFHHIDFSKPHADYILDDRMMPFKVIENK